MAHFLLFYTFAPDYLERRGQYRAAHLALAWAAADSGALLLGGALADPVDSGMLLFEGEGETVAEEFARNDPYVLEGLVTNWQVRRWTTVVGEGAATPVRLP
jgi:uncharacterized protein YciI